MSERKKGPGFGWVESWAGSERHRGKGNHSQYIVRKRLFSIINKIIIKRKMERGLQLKISGKD